MPPRTELSDPGISRRERQILVLITGGLTNKEISDCLGIATSTVNQHVHSLLLKLGASNRTQLAVDAVRRGIVACSPRQTGDRLEVVSVSATTDSLRTYGEASAKKRAQLL